MTAPEREKTSQKPSVRDLLVLIIAGQGVLGNLAGVVNDVRDWWVPGWHLVANVVLALVALGILTVTWRKLRG